MAEKKDQYIAAYIADYSCVDVVLSYALFLSNMLNKGLILLRIADPKYTSETTSEAEMELKKIRSTIPANVYATYCVLKGKTKNILSVLPGAFNVVAIVGSVNAEASKKSPLNKKNLLKDFSDCKTAFLIASKKIDDVEKLKKIAFSVDFKKESKDKLLWASYFSRFNSSTLHAVSLKYDDVFLRARWYDNMKFLDKMFASLNIVCRKHTLEKQQSQYIDMDVLSYSNEQNIGLLISVTTKERDVMEYFIGVQEDRTIVNEYKIPVLYLNPREDLYVLCD